MGKIAILVFFLAGAALILIANSLSNLISYKSDNPDKREPYESGMKTIGPTWIRFRVGYYLFALIFLIFDIEIVFLVPWATVFKSIGWVAFVEILVFLFILGLGLIYAWKKDALKWV
jgi:NADH-quinone oxidoreductase subunit A